jgi:2-isopropylmalate synthase
VGNTPTELMLVNMRLLGMIDRDLSKLKQFCETVAKVTHTTIPPNYPVVGRDAFRTATGVHAAALIKAQRKGDSRLADLVYSGVRASLFGMEQSIEVGPMSGKSNVLYWLEQHAIPCNDDLVERILQAAKSSSHVLADPEIFAICATSSRH